MKIKKRTGFIKYFSPPSSARVLIYNNIVKSDFYIYIRKSLITIY